jgi:hypothetical protein
MEMGQTYTTHEGDEKGMQILVQKPERKRPIAIILKRSLIEDGPENVHWIQTAQNKVQWWALENILMSLRVP